MIKEHLENLKNNHWLVDITKGITNLPVIRYTIHKNTIELISFVNKIEIVYLYPAKSSIMKLKPITKEQILEVEKIIEDRENKKLNSKT